MEDLTTFIDIYSQPTNPEGNADGSPSLFTPFMKPPPEDYSPYPSVSDFSGIGEVLAYPYRIVSGAASGVYGAVTGTIKSTYLYLLFGIAIIGIISIFILGAGTKFVGASGKIIDKLPGS